jgi:hypothetical protein
VITAIALAGCGALMAFVISPQQKLEAGRIDRMPVMEARDVAAADVGDDVLLTGRLEDNRPVEEGGLVAYKLEEWEVTPADPNDQDDQPDGRWDSVETMVPDLNLNVNGDIVQVLSANSATLSGSLHEDVLYGDGYEEAKYGGEWLPEGSWRYRGFLDGDLATVWGKKASVGGVAPNELFAGDRAAFSESKHSSARIALIAGICMMVLAPVVLVGGILGGLFGRRRRR